jgi:serine O-acetyltransferase
VTLGGTGKDTGKRHPSVRRGALISAHAQLLGPIEIGENARVGASAVVTKDVPEAVTVVGVPAKIVRVHGPVTPERDRATLEAQRHVSFYDHMGGI